MERSPLKPKPSWKGFKARTVGVNPISARQRSRNHRLATTKARLFSERGNRCEGQRLYEGYLLSGRERSDSDDVIAEILEARQTCKLVATDQHHIAGRGFKGCDDDDNLLLLCRACHAFATSSRPAAYIVGLIRKHNVKREAA